jgi:hypothetical protein
VGYQAAQHRTWGLIALALAALLGGLFVYLLDRPAGSAYLIPAFLQLGRNGPGILGAAGSWLPSFLHVYAFILLTLAFVRPTRSSLLLICMGWLSIELVFELIQHPAFLEFLAGLPGGWLARIPGAMMLREYATGGVFDPLDLVALGFGAVAAYLTAHLAWKEGKSS